MPQILLHPKKLSKLAPGEWRDTKEPALILRIRESGPRTWVVRYGKLQKRVTLAPADGRKGSLGLAKARSEAKKKAQVIGAEGTKAFAVKARAERAATLAEKLAPTFGAYVERLVGKADIRPSTRRGWESILKASIVPTLGNRKLAQITKADIVRALNQIKDRSVWAADSAHKLLTWAFRVAVERDLIPLSPMAGLRRADFRVKDGGRRKVVAGAAELKAVWTAAGDAGAYGAAVRLGMLTLARRSEIFEAEVSEFDLIAEPSKDGTGPDAKKRRAVWNIPANRRKNGEALTIPLSGDAWEIVEGLIAQATARGSQYLFPGDSGAYKPTSKAWAQLLRVAGLLRVNEKAEAAEKAEEGKAKKRAKWTAHPLRFHDLRRAGRAIMERELETPASVAEAVIGHLAPSLIRTYSPEGPGIPQRARALDAWSEYLGEAVRGQRERGKVLTGSFGR